MNVITLTGSLGINFGQEQIDSALDTVTGFLTSAEFGTGAVTTAVPMPRGSLAASTLPPCLSQNNTC